jgi:hypothetical protein
MQAVIVEETALKKNGYLFWFDPCPIAVKHL